MVPGNHPSRLKQIAEEHATIRATMTRIELELDRLRARPTQPDESWALPDLVRSFRSHLKRHFELEESGGLLGDAAAYLDPEAQEEVRQLIDEHRGLERSIDRICDEVGGSFVPGASVQQCFDGELRKLMAHLKRHEAAENALLERIVGMAPGAAAEANEPW